MAMRSQPHGTRWLKFGSISQLTVNDRSADKRSGVNLPLWSLASRFPLSPLAEVFRVKLSLG